jgi:hypothetical protein
MIISHAFFASLRGVLGEGGVSEVIIAIMEAVRMYAGSCIARYVAKTIVGELRVGLLNIVSWP